MKESLVIDLIHPHPLIWSGGLKDWKHNTKHGYGKKPVIKKMETKFKEKFSGSKVYPYELDEEKNIKTISGGRAPVKLLIPSTDIPEYSEDDYERSAYNKLNPEESQRIKQLQNDLEEEKREKKKYKRKYRRLSEEEEEQNKGNQSRAVRYKCDKCSETSSKTAWKDDDKESEDFCPECGEGVIENATEVNN